MLPSRIKPLPSQPPADSIASSTDPDPDDAEDLLSSFLHHLYPDEASSCLGNPGQTLLYASPLHGSIRVCLPDYNQDAPQQEEGSADVEAGRRLFAHYLWGGALVIAERIEEAERRRREGGEEEGLEHGRWSVEGKTVLEVGAGESSFLFFFI